MRWDVEHRRRPDNDECPVCGRTFDNVKEFYPHPNTTLDAAGRDAQWCVEAGCASASPDPTLIVYEHK